MKKITLLLIAFMLSAFCWQANAQLESTQTFWTNGIDSDLTTLTINSSEISAPGTITALSLENFVSRYNSPSGGTTWCPSWYEFDLDVTGGVADGTSIVGGCAAEFNGLDVTGFTTITITTWDSDGTSDMVYFYIDVKATYEVSCTQGAATGTVVADCANNQFSVNVDVTTVGDATHISNGTNTWAISGTGVVTVGPFASGSSQALTVVHSDTDCNLSLGNFTYACPASNTTCATAETISCGQTINASSVGSTGTSEGIGCSMGVNGLWYTFTGTGGDITVTSTASFDHRMGIGRGTDCAALTNIICRDNSTGAETYTIPLTTLGETYYVYIAHYNSGVTTTGSISISLTCVAPPDCTAATVASSTRVDDCANNQFNVEVDITNVGDAIHISNGTTTWPVSGTGVVTVGPFAVGGGAQTLTLVHSDTVCNVALGTFNLTACPPVNDLFANAIAINCGDTVYGTTIGATHDEADAPSVATQEPDTSADNDSPWVWYSFTGTVAGDEITLSTCGVDFTDFDTEIFVYTGTSGNLTLIDDGYDECGGSSANWAAETTFTSDGTSTYYIAIGGYDVDDIGEFRLVVSCESLSVENPSLNQSFTYFPNPVNNTLQLNAQSNIQNVSIFNMLGQEVLRTAPNHVNSTVDMSTLQTGAYFVKVTINDRTETVRVIKQ